MDLDPLSIIAPARIKVLLIPVGHVRQSRFTSFVQRLQQANVVRLGDVSPDSRPHRTMFSPLAFPEGLILYDLSTSLPPPSHLALSPFEFYREPLAVVGLADGVHTSVRESQEEHGRNVENQNEENVSEVKELRSLVRSLEDLIDDFPKALLHQILVFDHVDTRMPERIYPVPAPAKSRTTTIKTVMCDLTSRLLAEMANHARSIQGLPTLDSPRISSNTATLDRNVTAFAPHMHDRSKTGSSKSFSSSDDHKKSEYRISMPSNLPSKLASGVSTPDRRSASPRNGARTPPTSSMELTGSLSPQALPRTTNHDREDSRGRTSASALSAGSLGERERNKGKGRIGIAVGAMYLLAGRWPDAVKELVQNAAIARNCSDYLWHAKAMDFVLVCLLMFAWAGMDFRIPDNLFPGTEKPGSSSGKSSKHASINSMPDPAVTKSTDPASRAASLSTLTRLLPELSNSILNLYSRAWTFTDDKLPPLAFSQSAIRFAKLLSAIHLSHGCLDDTLLSHLVLNTDLPLNEQTSPEAVLFLTRGDIVDSLFRGYPGPPSETTMTIADQATVLAGIASVLSELGYHRKKAIVLKELMTSLLPALVQARKDGAAEMGVHPAASLASLNAAVSANNVGTVAGTLNDSAQGMRHFLSLVNRSYGILTDEPISGIEARGPTALNGISPTRDPKSRLAPFIEAIASRALRQASAKATGSQDLKIDILRSCINICEALPDLDGALKYSADLLRIGGSGIAPGPTSSDGSPNIRIEEQVRLVNNISRTLSAAKHIGLGHPEAEYWDDFLVRDVESVDGTGSRSLQQHAKSELKLVETSEATKEKNPFIYNPFLNSKGSARKELVLVAKEEAYFRVTLQNLFDFDVVIERVKLLSDGVPFECDAQSTIIGPYRTQTIMLSGIPQSLGSLTIHGCLAKIKGCRERGFPTFTEPWSLKPDVKGRHADAARRSRHPPPAADSSKKKAQYSTQGPIPSSLALNVLSAQPNVTLKSISAPQAAIMLLKGEAKTITITLQNSSHSAPADLLLLSFDDSTTSDRRSALSDKEISTSELYELELALARKQSYRWLHSDNNNDLVLNAGGEIGFEIELFGNPDLSYFSVQLDYAYLGIPKADIRETFYTRQLVIPLTVTVNSTLEITHSDIIALPSNLSPNKQTPLKPPTPTTKESTKDSSTSSLTDLQPLLTTTDEPSPSSPHCLLLLNIHNAHHNTLHLTFTVKPSDSTSSHPPTIHTYAIPPSATKRIPLALPRLYISNPYAPIPSLNPSHKRQFVVSASTSKNDPQAERTVREIFWYREALLSRLSATWTDSSTGRYGSINLRTLKLSPAMLAALKLPDLDITFSVSNAEPSPEPAIRRTAHSTYTVPLTTFLTLTTTLYNRSQTPIRPLLRLQPLLANQPQNQALDLNKKLLVNGLLQRALPTLQPGESRHVETGFLVLGWGTFEWRGSVEEVVAVSGGGGGGGKGDGGGRKRAGTGELDLEGNVGRRIWVAEERCCVVARDEGKDGGEGVGDRQEVEDVVDDFDEE